MKIAWFQGDIQQPEWEDWGSHGESLSQEAIYALPSDSPRRPVLRVLLVPDDFDLGEMWGDDWNDAPADCNAGRPYENRLPEDHWWLELHAGDPWPGSQASWRRRVEERS